jgi:hypothetical protein
LSDEIFCRARGAKISAPPPGSESRPAATSSRQGNKDAESALILSSEQRDEIKRFRSEQEKTRIELRRVKHELNRETQALKNSLVLANGFGVPILVLAAGIVVWGVRRSKMKSARESTTRS